MKPRKTSPTEGLVGIAMHVLFVFFILGNGVAVALNLAAVPPNNPIGSIVSTELHIGGNVHYPKHVDDVAIWRIYNDMSTLRYFHCVNLHRVVMPPILQSSVDGQLPNLSSSKTVTVPSRNQHAKNTSDQSPKNEADATSQRDKELQLIIGQAINECFQHFLFGMLVVGPLGLLIGYVVGNWWIDRNERRSLISQTNA